MLWWNANIAMLRAPLPAAASEASFGVWVRVMAYACEQECGGRLRGAALWGDRVWQVTCNVTADGVREAGELLRVDGDDVLVWGYPNARQSGLEALRREGAAGGSVKSSAKAQAARQNGRMSGRPRGLNRETQQSPTETQQKTHETQRAKPTGANSPSESMPKIPRESNKKESGGVGIGERSPVDDRSDVATTTTRIPDDPASPGIPEDDGAWLERLRKNWRGVDLDGELRRAGRHVRSRRGEGAQLSRRFFETEWLPRCAEPVVPLCGSVGRQSSIDIPEPEGWRACLAESKYGPGGALECNTWAGLPRDVKAYVCGQIEKGGIRNV